MDPFVSEKFYCAVVQAVLIFGAYTWVLSAAISKNRRCKCGFPTAGDGEEIEKSKVWVLMEGGVGQRALGGGNTTAPDLH